jgi:PAS domain S-box-containing protein
LRDRKPAIIGDILSDPRFAPWREAAARRGYRSIVALPLAPRQGPARVLCLYSVAAGVFDAETVELLQQLVGDLEYALDALEVRRQHGEAEAQVRRLFQAVEQSPVTVVITDASGAIQYVNPCFSRVTGYSREEAIGQNPRVLKSGVHPPEFYAELWARLESGREWRGQLCNRTKGGELFWEEAVISPVKDGDGRITSYIAVKEDVSERRKLEERLLQSQKMEAVGRLAGGIAHDFNNMLSVITGHVELALRTSYDGDPRRRHLLEVRKAAERAASLTRQLLAFSRKQVLQPKPIDLNAVLADMNKMLQRLIGEDVDLEIQPAAGLGTVLADPGQIEQVLLNLAVNARDAMPDGGRLTLATANVDLAEADAQRRGLAPPGRYVCLAVEDTGCGIRDEIREHIFEPFFTTKEPGKGTGLGLSTVYGIVKQSGGYIWVSSGVDRGARFDIYLPLLDQRPAQPDLLAPAPQRTAKAGTILLVEDNDALRGLVREMLEASGYTVVEAADGVEALQLVARNGAIDLLLTDVIMPRLGGRELARRAAALRPALKVLYTSGYTADAIAVQGVLEEGLAFLPKPFTPDALALKVDEALKSGATRDDTRPAGPAVAPRP